MKIDKRTALSLVKILSHYNSLTAYGEHYQVVSEVDDLISSFEDFILEDMDDAQKTFYDSQVKIDSDVYSDELCKLKPINGHVNNSAIADPGKEVKLCFKRVIKDEGEIDTFLSVNREIIGPISYIKLVDTQLQICTGQNDDRVWDYFDIENISDEWTSLFGKDNFCYRVINWE